MSGCLDSASASISIFTCSAQILNFDDRVVNWLTFLGTIDRDLRFQILYLVEQNDFDETDCAGNLNLN
jgi:hypothetical protein